VQLFGLSTPLITTSSGAKMGKSVAGAVWLNKDMLSVYDYWQFWRNTEDGDVGRFMRLFTDLPAAEIERLEKLQGAELNEAKKILATEATAVLHGRTAADSASNTARQVFEEGVSAEGLPTMSMDWSGGKGFTKRTAEAILAASGLVPSVTDARRKITKEIVYINDKKVDDPKAEFELNNVDSQTGAFKVQHGNNKKRIVLVKPN
jgi:tyrosyl-tRNA synthetase